MGVVVPFEVGVECCCCCCCCCKLTELMQVDMFEGGGIEMEATAD